MADMYVYNGGSNTAPYDTWIKASTKWTTAMAAQAAGGIVYVASDHTETEGANYTITATNGTASAPIKAISLDRTDDSYESMQDGGGLIYAGATYDISLAKYMILVGLKIQSGDDFSLSQTSTSQTQCIDCRLITFQWVSSGSGASSYRTILRDTDIVFTDDGFIYVYSNFEWIGGSVIFEGSGSINNGIIRSGSGAANSVVIGVDLSALVSGDYLIYGGTNLGYFEFQRCLLSGTISGFVNGAITSEGMRVIARSCSSSDVIYQFHEEYYLGVIDDDTAVYLDATYDGTNGYSAKMISTAYAEEWTSPLRFKLADIYIDATGKTLTVELLTDNVTLQDDEFWIEVEYPDSTIAAQGNIYSTKPATIVTTPSNLTASSKGAGDWTGESGTPVYQKVTADFTTVADEAAGVYTVWACLAKPSTTVYVDPKIVVA